MRPRARAAAWGAWTRSSPPSWAQPLLSYSLAQLETFQPVTRVAVVLDEDSVEQGEELVRRRECRKVVKVCPGGARRQDSVRLGLEALGPCDLVVVHDGARPCLDHCMLSRGLEAAREWGAAVAGVPVKDTIKVASPQGLVLDTPARDTLWAAQTPQVFRYSLIWEAHQRCRQEFTDDASMLESLGHPVKMFLGSYRNLKVTTPEDLAVAEAFLAARRGTRNS